MQSNWRGIGISHQSMRKILRDFKIYYICERFNLLHNFQQFKLMGLFLQDAPGFYKTPMVRSIKEDYPRFFKLPRKKTSKKILPNWS